MARRKNSSSGGGCLGTVIIIALIWAAISSILPYIIAIGAIVLVIWGGSVVFVKIRDRNQNRTRISSNSNSNRSVQNAISANSEAVRTVDSVPSGEVKAYILNETDRQIKDILLKRQSIKTTISEIEKGIQSNSTVWNKNNPKNISIREDLEDDKAKWLKRLDATIFVFHEKITPEFIELKKVLLKLDSTNAKVYDQSPRLNTLFYDYHPVGRDMHFIKFDVEPIGIAYKDDIFCLTPHYIVRFDKHGNYIRTYKTSAFRAGLANTTWIEKVAHQRYLHTRVDGGPDMRYSYNPLETYYTNVTHTERNVFELRLPSMRVRYGIDDAIKQEAIRVIKLYSATVVSDSLDQVHHILSLLKACNPNDAVISDIESIIEG